VLAGLCLAGILTALFVIVWRDYQQAVAATQSIRRVYGQLVKLAAINTEWIETGDTYPLLQLTTFGRAPTNTILLEDTFASGEHAQIALRNGQWWLEDRNSRNGTLLNGEKITMPIIVTSGDVIGIGNISFRLMLQ
jgi:predicted component of type VI protein secretion system